MPKSTFVTLKPSQDNPFPEDFEAAIKEMKRATNQNLELWYRSLYLKWLSIELKTPRLWFTS